MSSENTSEVDIDKSTSSINPKTGNGIYQGIYYFKTDLSQTQMSYIRKYAQELSRRQLSNKKSDWPKFLEYLEEFSEHFPKVDLDQIAKSDRFEGEKSRYGLAFSAILKSFFSSTFLKQFGLKGMSLFGAVNERCSKLTLMENTAMVKELMKKLDSWTIDTLVNESHTILYYNSDFKRHINLMLVAKLEVRLTTDFLNEYNDLKKENLAHVATKELILKLQDSCSERGIDYNKKNNVGESYLMEEVTPKKTKKPFCHYCKKSGHLIEQCYHKK